MGGWGKTQKKKGLDLGQLKAKQPAGKMIQVRDTDQAQVSNMHLVEGCWETQKKVSLGLHLLKAKQHAGKMIQVPVRDQAPSDFCVEGKGLEG